VRRDIEKGANTAERHLIDDLKKNLTTERLAQELVSCQQAHSQAADCTYVVRAAYRYLPEFKKQGNLQNLTKIFDQSQSRPFDQFLLTGYANAQAYQVALDWLAQRYLQSDPSKFTMSSNGFEIGVDRHFLIIAKSDCKKADLNQPFLIRYKDGSLKAQESFDFLQKGFEIGSTCIASIPLGFEKMQSIASVGQWVPKEGRIVWQVNIESKPKSGSQLLK
jgi:hypothetical protein